MLATGTGVAPFMSSARGLETYEQSDRVILIWGTRYVNELAFKDLLENLNEHEIWGDIAQGKFVFLSIGHKRRLHKYGKDYWRNL